MSDPSSTPDQPLLAEISAWGMPLFSDDGDTYRDSFLFKKLRARFYKRRSPVHSRKLVTVVKAARLPGGEENYGRV